MRNAKNSSLGLHGHAIILSLPPVFLVWAIITFSTSIVLYTIQNIASPSDELVEKAWLGVCLGAFGIISSLVLVALYTFAVMWDTKRRDRHILLFYRVMTKIQPLY
jgi:hypothetical protein